MRHRFQVVAAGVALAWPLLLVTACGDDPARGSTDGQPTVVVTTSILGDVVEHLVGDQADVDTVMPPGTDPHDFQPSAQQVARIRQADALVVNGGGLEEGLGDVVTSTSADGVPTFVALDAAGTDDAHFFTDPVRMADVARDLVDFLGASVDGIDREALAGTAEPYLRSLSELDAEVGRVVAGIPDGDRVLVTTHAVLGPFAERYGFDVVGTVIPGGSTADGASAGALADLARRIADLGVPAIFTDTSSSTELARTLAAEAGDVEVVELYTESLGDGGSDGATYLDLVRTNARRIADALTRDAP